MDAIFTPLPVRGIGTSGIVRKMSHGLSSATVILSTPCCVLLILAAALVSVVSAATATPTLTPPAPVLASLSASALKVAWRSHQLLPEPVKSNSFLQAPGAPRRRPGAFYTHNGSNLLVVWADNRKVNK